MKIYYVVNARMPTEKAHGIQIAKMCEAFIEKGVDLTLVVPRRNTDGRSVRNFYGLRVDVPVVRLFVWDWYGQGSFGYALASLSFMISYLIFLARKKWAGERYVLYTVDLDTFSSSALTFLHRPLFTEVHHARHATFAEKILFNNVQGVIAINRIIVEELRQHFPHSPAQYAVEPNGVDLASFADHDKHTARAQLGLPLDASIVLYSGQFFEWKGLEILPRAATLTPTTRWQIVGGDRASFARVVKEPIPSNMHFAGSRPFLEMPLWYAAADALVVLGTKRDIQSYRYTSPMKLFECFAAGRPIIASKTPALCEIVDESVVIFYEPDSAEDLARAIERVVEQPSEQASKISVARRRAESSSWRARAERICHLMKESLREIK